MLFIPVPPPAIVVVCRERGCDRRDFAASYAPPDKDNGSPERTGDAGSE